MDSAVRLVKLGLFVGWGAALAVVSACSSRAAVQLDAATAKPDLTRKADSIVKADSTTQQRDTLESRDRGSSDSPSAPDRRGWDVPLE